ncbi:Uncharacterised protein [Mycobacteroides abscessus subsp. abscessus]|nr:Uncharacterised protein [Mycobacteroides abscessus subsp. abscessus]
MQITDTAAHIGHRLALDLQDQTQHAVRGWMLRTHVDDDPFVGGLSCGGDNLIPVLAARHEMDFGLCCH